MARSALPDARESTMRLRMALVLVVATCAVSTGCKSRAAQVSARQALTGISADGSASTSPRAAQEIAPDAPADLTKHGEDRQARRAAPKDGAAPTPRLPEDPAAGERARQQWREHLRREEEERQMAFDRRRLHEHRAIFRVLEASRERYEHARTNEQLSATRERVVLDLAAVQQRIGRLDPWGVNSRLLPAYAALEALLRDDYASAKSEALAGKTASLERVREAFRTQRKVVLAWLAKAEDADEAAEEG